MHAKRFFRQFVLILLVCILPGCQPKKGPETPEPTAPTMTPRATTEEPTTAEPDEEVQEWKEPAESEASKLSATELQRQARLFNDQGALTTIFFETDKSDLSDDARGILVSNAAWMRGHPEFNVLIAGHCDERNTEEYNLALGDRRAEAVRTYLESLGVAVGRLETVSYGEELPANRGHDERAWSQNRRATFEVKAP